MKIQNLLEIIDTKVSTKKYSGKLHEPEENTLDRPRTGAFSTVKSDKKDPHMVIKHNHTPVPKDASFSDSYEYFIKWIIENKIYNIHFPRVYDVTKIEDSNGSYIYKYQVESLLGHSDVDIDELRNVIEMNFDVASLRKEIYFMDWADNDPKRILLIVGAACEQVINEHSSGEFIKNPEILRALKLLTKFESWASEAGLYTNLDLANSGNIMFRRTAQGLQIVFSDPVA